MGRFSRRRILELAGSAILPGLAAGCGKRSPATPAKPTVRPPDRWLKVSSLPQLEVGATGYFLGNLSKERGVGAVFKDQKRCRIVEPLLESWGMNKDYWPATPNHFVIIRGRVVEVAAAPDKSSSGFLGALQVEEVYPSVRNCWIWGLDPVAVRGVAGNDAWQKGVGSWFPSLDERRDVLADLLGDYPDLPVADDLFTTAVCLKDLPSGAKVVVVARIEIDSQQKIWLVEPGVGLGPVERPPDVKVPLLGADSWREQITSLPRYSGAMIWGTVAGEGKEQGLWERTTALRVSRIVFREEESH